MKQSPVAVNKLQDLFYLSNGEKYYLLSAGIGEGLFFAGSNHVAIQVIASENEHNLITTNPNETLPTLAASDAPKGPAPSKLEQEMEAPTLQEAEKKKVESAPVDPYAKKAEEGKLIQSSNSV
jgi:hypothetical protein